MKNSICALVGMIGSGIASIFGGWDSGLITLVILMFIDYISGLMVGGIFHNSNKTKSGSLESNACFKGLCKKCIILCFVLIGHRIDILLEIDYVKTGICIAFIVNELISIVENAGLMGIPIPKILIKAIEILKEKGENID